MPTAIQDTTTITMPTLEVTQDSARATDATAVTEPMILRPELTYPPPLRFYFAYGSNLSLTQMSRRCPTATYHSFGILRNHTWKIGPRGYANVVPSSASCSASSSLQKSAHAHKPVVYGALFTLEPSDEDALDFAEGVPFAYEKRDLFIEVLSVADGETCEVRVGQMVKALVYVDVKRTGDGICMEEYAGRLNRSIRDARKMGMPEWYIRDVMRKKVKEEEIHDDMPE
jgi:gamma-glutamylcyclotransferase